MSLKADGFADFLKAFEAMTPDERKAAEKLAEVECAGMKWVPWPGPQTDAFNSKADLLLFGGSAGSGKSDLGIGLAFTEHQRSLILRRQYVNLGALVERALEINGTRKGFNGSAPPLLRTDDGRYIQFGANQHPGDEQDWQGQPFDFKYFDEGTQFTEQQIRYHLGWLRSAAGHRCRAVIGSNPPLTADGDFIIGMFRPWLDLTHPKPAKAGELRWFVRAPDGVDVEVDGPTPVDFPGARRPALPESRTFIPGTLSDNPSLARTGYGAKLDALPEPLRSAVRDGNFMATRKDAEHQIIPMAWIIEAQKRWEPDGFKRWTMTAMSLDPAGGGKDSEELIWRHGPWFAEPVSAQGQVTEGSTSAAKLIFMQRRDEAPVVVDGGGGYAGPIIERLKDNGIPYVVFNGAGSGVGFSVDSKIGFKNKRAEAWWRFREALDPNQNGGSEIMLPPSPVLRADLAAPQLNVRALEVSGVIQVESKEEIRKRLGRSPGQGDAAVMCWTEGNRAVRRAVQQRIALPATADLGGRQTLRDRWRKDGRLTEMEDDWSGGNGGGEQG